MPAPGVRILRDPSAPSPGPRPAGALLGRVIDDRYRLIAPIAEGLVSSVFKAEHVRMGKILCVKVLRGPAARDPEVAARFRTEARVVSRLSHPHTIAVFDFGELEGNEGFYLAMEYLHGENLFDVLRREGRLPWQRAAAIGERLLGALGEAHDAGIVHRDVKPANVMLVPHRNDPDFVKLLDFGIAELEGQGPGGGLGTPTYLSPEQARGAAPDARSDLYSLGVMLYEMVAGRPPFQAENPLAVLSAHLHEAPVPLSQACGEVSPAFAAVVDRALAKRPEDRFESADAMRDALHAAGVAAESPVAEAETGERTGEMPIARRTDFPPSARKDPRRLLVPVLATVALTLAILLAATWIHGEGPREIDEASHRISDVSVTDYAGWRQVASRNWLAEGDLARAQTTAGEEFDTFALGPRRRSRSPDAVLLVPRPGLALDVAVWSQPEATGGGGGRPGFARMAHGEPGQPLIVRMPAQGSAEAPVLLQVTRTAGSGTYRLLALGPGAAAGSAVMGQLRELQSNARTDDALLVAAAFARLEPGSPARPDVLQFAARLAEGAPGKEKGADPVGPTP